MPEQPLPTRPEGLTAAEVETARQVHGWNELPRPPGVSMWQVALRQFTSFLVLLLIGAAGIALFLGEQIDALAIMLVVVLNAVLGFVQEWRAETAIDALRAMLSPSCLVIRDGREQVIAASGLVPGDVVIVEAGDRVPADLILTRALELSLDESVLTGESVPVRRAQGDAARMGTSVAAGRAEGRVSAIGPATSFGQIADLTGSVGEKQTDLQRKLGQLATQVGIAAGVIALAVLATGVLTGRPVIEMFMTGLSLAVAMVPEGLPAVVTITLALGAGAMVRSKALARRLQAVETLGAASVICTDKTGTLTENKMTVTRIWIQGDAFDVTGTGYDPTGHIARNGGRLRAGDDPRLSRLLDAAITCNHARLHHTGQGWQMVGEPTEAALVTLAYKGWAPVPDPSDLRAERPFSSDRKRMSVLAGRDGTCTLFTKGAPEQVLAAATQIALPGGDANLTDDLRAEILGAYERMAADGLRVIALADRPAGADDTEERDLTFLGLAGMIDPPRPEVAQAVTLARRAGIRVVMITGDAPITARAIARQLGLKTGRAVTGDMLDGMDDDALGTLLDRDVLFARTRPAHKMRLVQALQAKGQIVAMTGDGVNDAPALKQADIGVAMGIRGTDVARDAADLVLLDDNFATIVRAIGEGRRQFDNVRKFVRYLLSSNAGEVLAIMANIVIGGPLIFLATQILWMNLITDSITAVALGLERREPGQMDRPPRAKAEPILGTNGFLTIAAFGLYTGTAALCVFYHFLPFGVDIARTAAFTAMVMFEKVSVFAFRALCDPNWRIGWLSNPFLLGAFTISVGAQVGAIYWPPLQALLRTVPLGWEHWQLIGLLALPLIVVPEVLKSVWLLRRTPVSAPPTD